MNVELFSCNYCGECFCDCSINCICGRNWCSDKCAQEAGYNITDTCKMCRKEDASDSDLLEFLMREDGITREELLKRYFKNE